MTNSGFPASMPANERAKDFEHDDIFEGITDLKIKDIVVIGPVLVNRNKSAPWQIGVKGYRWSTVRNHQPSLDAKNDAKDFVMESVTDLRTIDRSIGPKEEEEEKADALPTIMDIDIHHPTFIVVASPIPNLTFKANARPISAKVFLETKKFGVLDEHCTRICPRLWSFAGPQNWAKGNHIMGWFSEYEKGMPASKGEHNYHMVLKGVALNSNNEIHQTAELPIIFDPGNNNGGTGGGSPQFP